MENRRLPGWTKAVLVILLLLDFASLLFVSAVHFFTKIFVGMLGRFQPELPEIVRYAAGWRGVAAFLGVPVLITAFWVIVLLAIRGRYKKRAAGVPLCEQAFVPPQASDVPAPAIPSAPVSESGTDQKGKRRREAALPPPLPEEAVLPEEGEARVHRETILIGAVARLRPDPREEEPVPVFLSQPSVPAPPEEEEAVAMYGGGQEAELAELEPPYLRRELTGTLADLKQSLEADAGLRNAVDVVIGGGEALPEQDRARLDKLERFDSERVLQKIRQNNALVTVELHRIDAAPEWISPYRNRNVIDKQENPPL